MFEGFFADMFDEQDIEVWDIVIFTYVTPELVELGFEVETEYILLEKYYKGNIYITAEEYYDNNSDYQLIYLENPHEDLLFKTGKTFESMKHIDETLTETIDNLKELVDNEEIPEFLEKLTNSNRKNNIQMMIDTAIDDGNFELAKKYMDEFGGEL